MYLLKIKGPNLPIFNDGTESYTIVTDDGIETVVAEHTFISPDRNKTPENVICDYYEDQRRFARLLLEMHTTVSVMTDRIVDMKRAIKAKYFPKS